MIRLYQAQEKDEPFLLAFIHEHYKKHHPLSNNVALFRWQYKNQNDYNFIIAKDNEINETIGIMGFIPNHRYDPSLIKDKSKGIS